jgi:hypothetical protein
MGKVKDAQMAPPSPAAKYGDAVRMAGAAGGGNQALWDRLGIGNPPPPPVPTNPTTAMAPPPPAPVAAVEAGAASAGAAKASRDSRGKKKEDTSGAGLTTGSTSSTNDNDGDGIPNNQDPDSGNVPSGPDANHDGTVTNAEAEAYRNAQMGVDSSYLAKEGQPGGLPEGEPIGVDPRYLTRLSNRAYDGHEVFQDADGNEVYNDGSQWRKVPQGAANQSSAIDPTTLSEEDRARNGDQAAEIAARLAAQGQAVPEEKIAALLNKGYRVATDGTVTDPTGHNLGNISDANGPAAAAASQASVEAAGQARKDAASSQAKSDAKFQEWIQKMLDEAGSSGTMDESQINDYVNKQHQRNAYEEARSLSAMMAGSGGVSPESFMGRSADVSQAYGTQGAADEAKTRLQLQMNNLQAEMQQSQAKMQAMAMAAQNAQSKEQRQWALDAQYAMQKKQAQLQQQMMQFQAELTKPDFGDVMGGMFTNVLGGGLNLLTMGGLGKLFGWGK